MMNIDEMQKTIIDSTIDSVDLQNENKQLKEEIIRVGMNNDILEKQMKILILENENKELKENLDFYKSIFKTHTNSAVFNLRIKSRGGKLLWIDKVRDIIDNRLIESLDRDDEVEEWLRPVRCER